MSMQSVGIDFGTTNSTIAVTGQNRNIITAKFQFGDQLTETFRSVLYFEQIRTGDRKHLLVGRYPKRSCSTCDPSKRAV